MLNWCVKRAPIVFGFMAVLNVLPGILRAPLWFHFVAVGIGLAAGFIYWAVDRWIERHEEADARRGLEDWRREHNR